MAESLRFSLVLRTLNGDSAAALLQPEWSLWRASEGLAFGDRRVKGGELCVRPRRWRPTSACGDKFSLFDIIDSY